MRLRLWFVHGFVFLFMVSGCIAMTEVKKFEERTPLQAQGQSAPIMFRKLVSKINRGQTIGTLQGGIFCLPQVAITWKQRGGNSTIGDEELADTLREELVKAGYQVVGDPSVLFDNPQEWQAEYLIAGTIKHVAINLCSLGATSSGEASFEVEWQLYERRTRSVVLTLTTGGTAKTSFGQNMGMQAYYDAFAQSVRNLLAEKQFAGLVSRGGPKVAEKGGEPIPIEVLVLGEKEAQERPSDLIQHAYGTVVTIHIGSGHGSGVIVSPSGIVLTDAHVVGEGSAPVTVELPSGRRLSGEVIRRQKDMDVALVKLEKGLFQAAPIGSSERLKVGDTVYAIGTPLHQTLGRSLTKGIVSGFRMEEGRRLIQSDAIVHSGSSGGPLLDERGQVVGIAQSGVALGGRIGIGLNFFTPIEDALKALQAEPKITKVSPQELSGIPMTGTVMTSPGQQSPSRQDIEEKLRLIREFRQKGFISEDEAERRRKELFDRALR